MNAEAVLEKSQAIAAGRVRQAQQDPVWVRWGLTLLALLVIGVLVVIPVVNIFVQALSEGVGVYWQNLFADPDTRHSIILTLTVVPIALAANVLFGITAAWSIARFHFPGRTLLTALIDLPFAVSPVVAGLMFVLIFGLQGYFGAFLRADGYSVMPYLISLLAVVVFSLLFFLFRPVSPQARARLMEPSLAGRAGGRRSPVWPALLPPATFRGVAPPAEFENYFCPAGTGAGYRVRHLPVRGAGVDSGHGSRWPR